MLQWPVVARIVKSKLNLTFKEGGGSIAQWIACWLASGPSCPRVPIMAPEFFFRKISDAGVLIDSAKLKCSSDPFSIGKRHDSTAKNNITLEAIEYYKKLKFLFWFHVSNLFICFI